MILPTNIAPNLYPTYPNRPIRPMHFLPVNHLAVQQASLQPDNWPPKPYIQTDTFQRSAALKPQVGYPSMPVAPPAMQQVKPFAQLPSTPMPSPNIASEIGPVLDKKMLGKMAPGGVKVGFILGLVTMMAPLACLLMTKNRNQSDDLWNQDFHREPFPARATVSDSAEEVHRDAWEQRERGRQESLDESLARLLQVQERFRNAHTQETHRPNWWQHFNLNASHGPSPIAPELGHTQLIPPLREEQLPPSVRKQIDDLRSLLRTQPNELVDIFVHRRRGQSSHTEFCFSFEDPDKFPEALKREYDMGQIDFFLPDRLVPANVLVNKERLGTWLNTPPLPISARLRVPNSLE